MEYFTGRMVAIDASMAIYQFLVRNCSTASVPCKAGKPFGGLSPSSGGSGTTLEDTPEGWRAEHQVVLLPHGFRVRAEAGVRVGVGVELELGVGMSLDHTPTPLSMLSRRRTCMVSV